MVSKGFREGRDVVKTYHVIDLVYTDQSRSKLEHIVAQRNNDELGVLGALFDVSSDDGNLGNH
jgi:hypothetical protein